MLRYGNLPGKKIMSLFSKDNDFLHLSNLLGCPPKVVRLGCGNRTTSYILELLLGKYPAIQTFINSTDCYMEII
jgi:predicted nuclease of predicted toxin-antitoxin system